LRIVEGYVFYPSTAVPGRIRRLAASSLRPLLSIFGNLLEFDISDVIGAEVESLEVTGASDPVRGALPPPMVRRRRPPPQAWPCESSIRWWRGGGPSAEVAWRARPSFFYFSCPLPCTSLWDARSRASPAVHLRSRGTAKPMATVSNGSAVRHLFSPCAGYDERQDNCFRRAFLAESTRQRIQVSQRPAPEGQLL
jgi:hypothetical protein